MEETPEAIIEEVLPEESAEVVEEKEEPVVEAEEVAEEEAPEETPEETPEEKPPSRRESLRIQALLAKYGEPDARPEPRTDTHSYKDSLEADEETLANLERDRSAYGQSQYNEGLKQAQNIQFHTRLEIDAPKIEAKYGFLNKDSKEFNPLAADAMNSRYLQFVGYNKKDGSVRSSDIRYSDFVEAEMEFADEIANHRIANTTRNIAKQAAQTGLRPDGSAARKLDLSKDPGQMSDKELDAYLAQNAPSKKR